MLKHYLCILGIVTAGWAYGAGEPTDFVKVNDRLIEKLGPSVVQVDYFFKLDESGKEPQVYTRYKCPNCNNFHEGGVQDLIDEQRPLTVPGFVIKPGRVVSGDMNLLSKWVDRIEVQSGKERVKAKIVGYYPDMRAIELELEKPLDKVKPLEFTPPGADGKLFCFYVAKEDGVTIAGTRPDNGGNVRRNLDSDLDFREGLPNTLLTDGDGNVVTVSLQERLPVGADRFATPDKWRRISVEERLAGIGDQEKIVRENFYPVRIRLSSESSGVSPQTLMRRKYSQEEEEKNEFDTIGMKLPDGKLLIRQMLAADKTARLEQIQVILPNGKRVAAKFIASLKDWGMIVAEPEGELPGEGVKFFTGNILELFDHEALIGQVENFDGKLQCTVYPVVLDIFTVARGNRVIPEAQNFQERNCILFSRSGEVILFPLELRSRLKSYDRQQMEIVAGVQLADMLKQGTYDPENIPRSKEERGWIAWSGVDLQELTPELAKAHRASGLTENGDKGLLVSRVRPDSPAAKAGIKVGDILTYLRPEGDSQRIELNRYDFRTEEMFEGGFPWNEYDNLPEQYFDQIPTPWPLVANEFNRKLTQLGIGKNVHLGVVSDGVFAEKTMKLEKSPVYFDNAPRFVAKKQGLTVADPTFEVREYFRLGNQDPGLIVAKVVPGSSASVAGIKPYEIILSVDDQPVHTVADFERLTKDKDHFKLAVRRLSASRVVQFKTGKTSELAP